jgi:hypothetical protein
MNSMEKVKLLEKLSKAEKYYVKEKYLPIVKYARKLFENGKFGLCDLKLNELPSSAELLEQLRSKLKNKHLCRTLRKIEEGKAENSLLVAKGLSSLLTHIIIECEHGNEEYKLLIPNVVEKINEVVYGLYGQGE